jgi:outer membrane protein assembly factor BamB
MEGLAPRPSLAGRRFLIAALITGVAVAGCGGDGDDQSGASGTVAPSTSTAAVPVTTAPSSSASATTGSSVAPSVPGCGEHEVTSPGIVALTADGGRRCWSALAEWNPSIAAVADGRVIVWGYPCQYGPLGAQPTTVALDAATGRELWQYAGEGPPFSHAWVPLGTGSDVVVVPGGNDAVVGLDVATGAVRWMRPGAYAIGDGPDVTLVLDVETSENLVVLDRRTGQERWSAQPGYIVAAVATDAVVLLAGIDSTVAYDAVTGERRWEAPFTERSEEPLFLVDGVAAGAPPLVGIEEFDFPGETVTFDSASGDELWTRAGQPVAPMNGWIGENLYVGDGEQVYALDPRSGEVRWSLDVGGFGHGGMAADQTFVVDAGPGLLLRSPPDRSVADGAFTAMDPSTGAELWSRPLAELDLPEVSPPTATTRAVIPMNTFPTDAGVFLAYSACPSSG